MTHEFYDLPRPAPQGICSNGTCSIGKAYTCADGTCSARKAPCSGGSGSVCFDGCMSRVQKRCKPPGVIQYIVSDSTCSNGVSGTCTSGSCSAGGTCSGGDGSPCEEEGTCSASQPGTWSNPPSADGTCSLNGSSCSASVQKVCTTNWEYKLVPEGNCPPVPHPDGICGDASGGCSGRAGGGNLSQEQCDPRGSACNSSLCDSTTTCCPGDTWPSNNNCPNPCVTRHGKTCCAATDGGTCSGRFCCSAVGTCNFKDIGDGVCRPTCAYLAQEKGYTGDGVSDTSNYTGTWTQNVNTCAKLSTQSLWGSDNWVKIPLIENKEPQEVIDNNGGECCGRPALTCNSTIECCDGDKHTLNGGSNDKCPVDGKCGPDKNKPCIKGTYDSNDSNDGNDSEKWICKGLNDGDKSGECGDCDSATACCENDTYPTNPHCPADGECGDGNPDLCNVGQSDPQSPNLATQRWTCKGPNEGQKSIECCHSSNPVCDSRNGVCGQPCEVGVKKVANDGTETWECLGTGSGTPSGVCPVDGVCSETGCTAGNEERLINDPNKWICKGIGTGSSDSSTCEGGAGGVCSSSGCEVGTRQDNTDGTYLCKGINGGEDSDPCPKDGKCGDYHDSNKCQIGTEQSRSSTNPKLFKWDCKGVNGGKTDHCDHNKCECGESTCRPSEPSCLIPVCKNGAECSNCAGHGSGNDEDCCGLGVFHPHPADTTTQCRWTCKKSAHDSAGADSCSAPIQPPLTPECGDNPTCDNCAGNGSNGAAGCCKSPAVFNSHPSDTSSTSFECQWTCRKSAHDSAGATSCNVPQPLPVCTCGSAIDTCSSGCTAASEADSSWVSTDHPQGHPGDVTTIETKVEKWKCMRAGDLNTASAVCQHATTKCHSYAHTDTVECMKGDRKVDGTTYPVGAEECTAQTTGPTSCNFLQCSSNFSWPQRDCGCHYVTCNVHPVN